MAVSRAEKRKIKNVQRLTGFTQLSATRYKYYNKVIFKFQRKFEKGIRVFPVRGSPRRRSLQ